MNIRDLQQIASFCLALFAIGIVIYKMRRRRSYPFLFLIFYLPPLVVFILTAIYYLAVYIDLQHDFIVSGDVSATLRVIDIIMWILVISANPPKAKQS